jgi:hypothetical protein
VKRTRLERLGGIGILRICGRVTDTWVRARTSTTVHFNAQMQRIECGWKKRSAVVRHVA